MIDCSNSIVVGVDVAADFSYFCILTPNGKEFRKPFRVDHNPKAVEKAALTIRKAEELYSTKSTIFMESTGIYHFPLFCFLKELGFEVFVLNPLITNSTKNCGIRKVKNDKRDAKYIAKLGLSGDLKVSVTPDDFVINLRCLCREYYSLVDNRSEYVNKLQAQLHVVFPGFLKVFSDVTGKAAFAILKQYPTPEDILNASHGDIIDLIAFSSRKGLSWARNKYEKLADAASDALNFRYYLPSVYHLIDVYISFIQQFDEKISSILTEIHDIIDKNQNCKFVQQLRLIESLPGVGFISAFTIMCEIGNFDAFKNPRQLFAYFGIDPSVKESGKFKGSKNRMSKRGSRIGRRALYAVAIASVRSKRNGQLINPVLHNYYKKKLESKPKKVALGAIMHKLCNIIFAVLRDEKPFVLKTPEEHNREYRNIRVAA